MLSLTPAYDICPQGRSGNEASQAMLIAGEQRLSRLSVCLEASRHFLLSEPEALAIIENLIMAVLENWNKVCDRAMLSPIDRAHLWRRQFLNPFVFEDLHGAAARLTQLIEK
jgi:serine/threonine-protein kinase HipA